jgi:antitoxin (DNA-binding transcriptional repressor) of toxin-antitoxin stability system
MTEGIRRAGVREFRDHATEYLAGSEVVAVTRHGRVIGYYVPVRADEDEAQRALHRLGETVDRLRARTGLSEDELSRLVDLRRQLPE